MENIGNNEAVLILDDGIVIKGRSFGKRGTAIGELCFNTGMMGYQEIFSDPSYFGQILIMNHVQIGNYGISTKYMESNGAKVNGVIGRNFDESLEPFFFNQEVVAIDQIDTRALVKHIRERGMVRCLISSKEKDITVLKKQLKDQQLIKDQDLVSMVSTQQDFYIGHADSDIKIALIDLGVKNSIIDNLVKRGAFVKVFNANSTLEALLDFKPNGFLVSNGPGNPATMGHAISLIKKIVALDYPLFGICLGHQLLALANGISTFKMVNGHRGCNHPVKNILTGRAEITTQNHGYGVDLDQVRRNENIEITHINLNDQSIEGIRIKGKKAFSVQFHPESSPGTHDSQYLFDDFFRLIKNA
jgi:carbamoyl-phosphate synthase small subunit